jgi:hypothetical protein
MLIAFHGKIASGKTTSSAQVIKLLPEMPIEEKAFADNLKRLNAALCLSDLATQYSEHGKNLPVTFFDCNGCPSSKNVRNLVMEMKRFSCFATAPESRMIDLMTNLLEDVYRSKHQFGSITVGILLQELGSRFRVIFSENIWVDLLFDDWTKEKNWIISDLRFPNEYQAILQRGGKCVKLLGDPKGVRSRSKRDLMHISEIALDHVTEWDFIINNQEDNIENLRQQLQKFLIRMAWMKEIAE